MVQSYGLTNKTDMQNNNNGNGSNPAAKFARWVIKWRWIVILGCVVMAMMAGSGGQYLSFNNDYHIFFDHDNPHVLAFDELQEKYTKDDNVFMVIAPENGDVFTKETLAAIEELADSAWLTPFSSRVDALSNFQHTRAEGDDMFVESLASDAMNKSDAEIDRIRKIALNERLLVDRLVNKEGTVTAVNITVTLPEDDMQAPMKVMNYCREMAAEWEERHPGHKTYLSGIIMMNGAFAESSMGDMATLVPIMFLVILLVVAFSTRSASSMIASFFVLLFSIMTAMGLAGWTSVELTGPSSAAPTMIMTLAIADSIHLLVIMLQQMRHGKTKHEAIVETVRINFKPIFLTSVSTMIGFLTLNFTEGQPFHDLGNITATGVAAAFIYSIFLLPALMSLLPVSAKPHKEFDREKKSIVKLGDFVIGHHKKVLITSSLAVIIMSAFSLRNELNNEFVKFFDESVPFRTDTDFISENLTGVYNVEYSLYSGEADGISDPEYLKKVDEFETWFRQQPKVFHVNAFSETTKRVNVSMHGDDRAYYKVPEAKNEAAQYLLLYEMSLPYGLDLNNQINVDKSETRFSVTTDNVSSNEMLELTISAENWLRENAPEHMFSYGISPTVMFSHIGRTNMDSMMMSGIGALFLISFILMFALRSFKYGLISIIPNVTPIAVAFGIWGLYNGQINMGLTVVLGMTLGIVVDDTVHLLSKYIRARREMGKTPEEAVHYAFETVGRAVIITTVILCAGFGVLMFSHFGFNSDMAKLTAITIVSALVLDLLLLPAVLLAVDRSKMSKHYIETHPEAQTSEA